MKKVLKSIYNCLNCWKFKHITLSSRIGRGVVVYNSDNLVMEEHTNIDTGGVIMNTRAKFVMKRKSGAAIGLMVITGNHMSVVGRFFKDITDKDKDSLDKNGELDKDVIVEEDVWIGADVTLLSGTHIGRGAVVGTASVVRGKIPPYSIVIGNPAKVIGFRFTPVEILSHEESLYCPDERLSLETLNKNYEKFFMKRLKEIQNIVRV